MRADGRQIVFIMTNEEIANILDTNNPFTNRDESWLPIFARYETFFRISYLSYLLLDSISSSSFVKNRLGGKREMKKNTQMMKKTNMSLI